MSENNLALLQRDLTDQVAGKVKQLEKDGLTIAPNYNPANALKSAFFAITNSNSGNLLEKCKPETIANSLLDMVIQGLSPAKTQCYFIPYGDTLKMTRSYFGTQKVVKSLSNVIDIWANVIYQDDVFDYAIIEGRERLVEHKTSFENRDKPVVGAYCIIKTIDQGEILTVMTKNEIDVSWSQSKNSSVQKKYPQEMAKRTVINRAAKAFINTSDDSDMFVDSINRTTENEFDDSQSIKDVTEEISQKANVEELDFPEPEPEIIGAPAKEEPKRPAKKLTIEDVSDIPLFNTGVKSTLDDGAPF